MAPKDSPIWFKTFMNDDARHPKDLGHKFMADIAVWSIQQVQGRARHQVATLRMRCLVKLSRCRRRLRSSF